MTFHLKRKYWYLLSGIFLLLILIGGIVFFAPSLKNLFENRKPTAQEIDAQFFNKVDTINKLVSDFDLSTKANGKEAEARVFYFKKDETYQEISASYLLGLTPDELGDIRENLKKNGVYVKVKNQYLLRK